MNVGMQRRIGKLPKTPELAQPGGSGYYGGSHAGFRGRRPTPTSHGLFGPGSIYGDGQLHYYGNSEGQSGLPASGIYGTNIGYAGIDLDAQVAAIAIPGSGSPAYEAASEGHLFGDEITESFATKQTMILAGAALGLIYLLRK